MPAPAVGPDWSLTGTVWVPDVDHLDPRFTSPVDDAFEHLGETYVLVRWQDNQPDVSMIERWWTKQRALLKSSALARVGPQPMAVTLGHATTVEEGVTWKVRTVKVNRTRPKAAVA